MHCSSRRALPPRPPPQPSLTHNRYSDSLHGLNGSYLALSQTFPTPLLFISISSCLHASLLSLTTSIKASSVACISTEGRQRC
uniref:Uncharacterized protein n=1 Tax=Manihot esculenta TaxID=3983 RepID=A0A2C9W575_MANES